MNEAFNSPVSGSRLLPILCCEAFGARIAGVLSTFPSGLSSAAAKLFWSVKVGPSTLDPKTPRPHHGTSTGARHLGAAPLGRKLHLTGSKGACELHQPA